MAEFPSTSAPPASSLESHVAHVRHELLTPINAIIGYSEMLAEDLEAYGSVVTEPLERLVAAGKACLSAVKRAMSPSRFGPECQEWNPSVVSRLLQGELDEPLRGVREVGDVLHGLFRALGQDAAAQDLDRIKASAALLSELVVQMADVTTPIPKGAKLEASSVVPQGFELDEARVTLLSLDSPDPKSSPSGGRVLIVDDVEMNRDVLARRLSRAGHSCELAASGEEALRLLEQKSFDIILLDLVMPGFDGYQVLQELKASDRYRHIPVIMLSALDQTDNAVRCIEMGADDFLPKPFNPTLLRARLGSSLDKKRFRDREHQFMRELQAEREKSEQLLLNILPPSIALRLKEGEEPIADSFSEVTVLFSDLVGFTNASAQVDAHSLVGRLNELFRAFDELTKDLGVEKIKTIGDAYMAVAGLPEPCEDHALRMARMATRMLEAVEQLNQTSPLRFEVRVGMHTGPVVAGVIGTRKFAYDLWGDTVNTASRMESHGLPGRIQISQATHDRLEPYFEFEPRGPIEIKGKGEMNTFLLGAPKR